ncbi:phage tail assembly chaperone [Pseudomonas orientalis]|uniref:phage tail assembly chaperone n=1 Tax=Pseudomonas orientalis TaxID=76758 RepID=UPI002FE031C2
MSKLFSPATMGFYDSEISTAIPLDAFEIADDLHAHLIAGPSQGFQMALKNGKPYLVPMTIDPQSVTTNERRWRDAALAQNEWLVTRHRDDREMNLDTVLSEAQFSELLIYRRALRDWPESKFFPKAASRPTEPIWLAEQLAVVS